MADSGSQHSKSFWITLAGVLTAIAAAIGAITGLVSTMRAAGWIGSQVAPPAVRVEVVSPSATADAAQAAEMERLRQEVATLRKTVSSLGARSEAAAARLPDTPAARAKVEEAQALRQEIADSEARLAAVTTAAEAASAAERNIEFERLRFEIEKLSQMQQALSNVLNTMDELAKQAISKIKV